MKRRRFIVEAAAYSAVGALAVSAPALARPLIATPLGLYCILEHSNGLKSRQALSIVALRRHSARFAIDRSTRIDAIHFGVFEPSFRLLGRHSIDGPFDLRRGDVVDADYFCGGLWLPSFSSATILRADGCEKSEDFWPGKNRARTSRPWPMNIYRDEDDDEVVCDAEQHRAQLLRIIPVDAERDVRTVKCPNPHPPRSVIDYLT